MTTTRRTTRRTSGAALLVLAAALAGAAAPTGPASAADTLVTFTVAETTGPLSISAPATASLGSATQGSLLSGTLGDVTVDDQRGTLVGGWNAEVSASAATSAEGSTIPASAMAYTTGAAQTEPLSLALDTSTASAVLGGALPVPAATSVSVGKSRATWSPTLRVDVPDGTPPGTYSFTLTHSVS